MSLLASCTKKADIGKEQATTFVKYFGGSSTDRANDIVACAEGGYAITGSLTPSGGIPQAFFIRTDQYGNSLTNQPLLLGNGYHSAGNSIYQTSDGGFLVVGYTIPIGHSDKNILLVKIKPDGTIAWTNTTFGGSNDDEAFSVTEVGYGYILIGGYTSSFGNGGKDAWCLLLENNGSEVWDKTYGFSGDEVCYNIIQKNDYYLLTGYTESYQYASLGRSVFLVKIDKASGNILDSQYYGGANNETGVKSIVDAVGNIYVLGNSVVGGNSNLYLLKLTDNIHQVVWEKYLTSSDSESGDDIEINNNQLIIVGSSTSDQNSDFLIDHLDANGQLLNDGANILNAKGNQSAQACVIGSDGKIVFVGYNEVSGFYKVALVKTSIP